MKRADNRTPLQDVIPLETPYVVHIETNNTCNFKCKFCFESNDQLLMDNGIKRGFMKKETFEKIIDDMKGFPQKIKRLYFHVAGEPLLHKDIIYFIKFAKKAQVAKQLVMFTNGALLNDKLGTELAHAGLDIIQISVEGVSDKKYEEITGCKINYETFLKNIEHLYHEKPDSCILHAKIIDSNLSEQEKKKFYDDFAAISDECYIEQLLDICPTDVMDTTLGNGQTVTQEGKSLKEKLVCTIPFYVTDINYDGSVDACSCDWRRKLIMGNVLEENFCDIWNGEKFVAFREMQLEGNRKKCKVCNECKAILYQLDDIDLYKEVILKKIKSDCEILNQEK